MGGLSDTHTGISSVATMVFSARMQVFAARVMMRAVLLLTTFCAVHGFTATMFNGECDQLLASPSWCTL